MQAFAGSNARATQAPGCQSQTISAIVAARAATPNTAVPQQLRCAQQCYTTDSPITTRTFRFRLLWKVPQLPLPLQHPSCSMVPRHAATRRLRGNKILIAAGG